MKHRLHGDIDCASRGIGGDDPVFEILDFLDRAALKHHVFFGIVVVDAVLELVGDKLSCRYAFSTAMQSVE